MSQNYIAFMVVPIMLEVDGPPIKEEIEKQLAAVLEADGYGNARLTELAVAPEHNDV